MREPFLFVSDTHGPYHSRAAIALVCSFAERANPRLVIFGGDMLDVYGLNGFGRGTRGFQTIEWEFEVTKNEVILPLIKVIKKSAKNPRMIWLEGNHEDRYHQRLEGRMEGAGLGSVYSLLPDIPTYFELEKHGVKYVKSKGGNAHIDIGPHLTFSHGSMGGVNPSKSEYDKNGGSIIFGHSHKETSYVKKSGKGHHHKSLGAGHLSQGPSWLDRHNWTMGFVSGSIDPETGEFDANHETIVQEGNRFSLYSSRGHFVAVVRKDGSIVVQFPIKKKPVVVELEEANGFVVPPFKRIDAPQQPDLLPNVLRTSKDVQLLIAQYNLFAIQSQKILDDQDDDDVEMLLLLVA